MEEFFENLKEYASCAGLGLRALPNDWPKKMREHVQNRRKVEHADRMADIAKNAWHKRRNKNAGA